MRMILYTNAAVDQAIADAGGATTTVVFDNLFDGTEDMTLGGRIIDNVATIVSKTASSNRMAKIPVTPGVRYSYSYAEATHIFPVAFLDATGAPMAAGTTVAASVNQYGYTFLAPVGAAFAAIQVVYNTTALEAAFNEMTGLHVIEGVLLRPAEVTEVNSSPVRDDFTRKLATSRWTGKYWCAYGDSITELGTQRSTMNYWGFIRDRLGVNVTDYGQGSASIHEFVTGTSENLAIDIYERVKGCPTRADLVTVMIGTNDFTQGLATVGIGTATDTTDDTIAGCIYLTIQNLMARVPNATIAFITPLPRKDGGYPSYPGGELTAPGGWTMTELADMIIAVCRRYSVPVLDAYRSSFLKCWNPTNVKTYTYAYGSHVDGDGLHPNLAGHEAFSWQVQRFIESL